MTDWIEWKGGDCPVSPSTIVDVEFRDGDQHIGDGACAEIYHWGHYDAPGPHPEDFFRGADIISYRVIGVAS